MLSAGLLKWKSTQQTQVELCEVCRVRPKFVENGVTHQYCGRTCARSAQGANLHGCKLRGCRATGKSAFANFCTEDHAKQGVSQGIVEACENCATLPRMTGTLCIPCSRRPQSPANIRELPVDGATFKNYREHFINQWKSPEPIPIVEKVFEVDVPRDVRTKQDSYLAKSSSAVKIVTYHSSQCICNFGANTKSVLCKFKSCGICCIVKSSFKLFAFNVPHNQGRFGYGVYSYRNSALADRFATSCTTSPYRVSIGCSVIVESGTDGSRTSTESVSVFVPTVDAIVPKCIIVYRK